MLTDYSTIGIYLLLTVLFPVGALVLAWMVRPKPKSNADKLATYECGVDTIGPTWVRLKVNYFLYALIFLVFSIETIFLFPWAVKFNSLGLFAFIEMLIFIAILVVGLWYAWKEGALEWY
ncbi:MAG TPA: NADH-quinone oxidoreductase subunit A [Syntrophomonadaceae bacterium]|nr:NADH-quinone oxidoreductase subunit A [Syntrophomonadaceae bacterium]